MKKKSHIQTISELLPSGDNKNIMRKLVHCLSVDYTEAEREFSSAIYLDAFISILVLSGTATIYINYKSYSVESNTLLVMSSSHLFHFNECSKDFNCQCLFVSKDFMQEMDSTDMIYKRIKYGVRLYNTPAIRLKPAYSQLISERMSDINKVIDYTEHFYYKERVLNAIFTFYLDLSDIIERHASYLLTNETNESNLNRYESIIKSFIELLAIHYREEHKVDFYSSRLNLSAHYLTQIVKQVTGQSASDFIFEMLYSEARNLLTHSKLSIQEIASALNFSDQSSFGKFFKRKAGISPADFRKGG